MCASRGRISQVLSYYTESRVESLLGSGLGIASHACTPISVVSEGYLKLGRSYLTYLYHGVPYTCGSQLQGKIIIMIPCMRWVAYPTMHVKI